MSDLVLYQKEGRIARVTLNSPKNLNAWTFPRHPGGMTAAFIEKMNLAAEDDDVTVVIIDSSGRAFSSGADVTHVGFVYGMGNGKDDKRRPSQRIRLKLDDELMGFYKWLFLFPKVTIAQVNGVCLGLGFIITSFCDLCVAAKDAKLMRTDQRLGVGGNSLDFNNLVANIGLKRTMKFLLTGGTLSGEEAEKWGLINDAVEPSELRAKTLELAQQVACQPRDGIAIGKAVRKLNFESLGLLQGIDIHHMGHTMFTNLRWEEDEFNYFRERREQGAKEAFRKRDARFEVAKKG